MRNFNCARVHVGNYSYGYISFMPQDDTYLTAKCGYEIVKGNTIVKRLRPIRIRGAQDSEGDDKYHILESFVIYPSTDEAIIRIFNRKDSHLIKLVKHQKGIRSTIYKMKL